MLTDIFKNKDRLQYFFRDLATGFLFIWNSGKRLTIINFLLFAVKPLLPLASLMALKKIIDLSQQKDFSWQHSSHLIFTFAGLQLLNGLLGQLLSYLLTEQQQIISNNVSRQILEKAIVLDLEYYENPSFYDELHMVQQQSQSKPGQLISSFQGILQNTISIVLFSGFMLMVHWSILLLLVGLSIPLAITKLQQGYRQYRSDREIMPSQRKSSDLFNYLTSDTYAKEVRLFSFGPSFINQFLDLKKYIFKKRRALYLDFLKQNLFIQFFEIAIVAAIYFILINSAVIGTITIGGLVIYFQIFQRLQSSINGLYQSLIGLFNNQLYLRQMLDYLASPALIKNNDQAIPMTPVKREISVRNLDFTYPDTDRRVLNDINMTLKPGQITAIVGENGSGKSTLIKLLCRLYESPKESIFLDDKDIADISIDDLRKNITVLFQDFGKYYLTVEENITLGSPEKDETKLKLAEEMAGLGGKLSTFPEGSKTQLGRTFKNGEQLSGGQWQKIALARMFYKDSSILILDEPTSSMDPVAEHDAFHNLKSNIGDKIIVLITHRLYNLKMADYVYVMENGCIAEHGRFEELLAANGKFAHIYDKQKI